MDAKRKRRRDWGQKSPLDRLNPSAKAALARRFDETPATYADTVRWLWEAHGIKSSVTAVFNWAMRRDEAQRQSAVRAQCAPIMAPAGFEIFVHAPGARQVRVEILPLRSESSAKHRPAKAA